MSKNDGALITFTDELDETWSCDPTTVIILKNVDPVTHISIGVRPFDFYDLNKAKTKKLEQFQNQYHGALTSADLQTFILGMDSGIEVMRENPWFR